ncbi:hypothetical protein C8R44DRAFT_892826 [Mycena epipterygia]|nr:hypothetical protein C8R44DRAFT_892826 [Mycena epipterygia]
MTAPNLGVRGISRLHADSQRNAVRESNSDEACSKIWSVYTAEAEKQDKALMESWMRDMKGVLIFAALFSASLTAFIVESYKTLQPDASETVIALLTKISGQMGNTSDSAFLPATPQPRTGSFVPTTSSLLCNALWFISLFLSLTCALLATLVEQWARAFIQKMDGKASPVIRAKIFSYLYRGLKQFDMHTVVDLIPVLLHTSLIMFSAGLVAFLIPINSALVVITAVWMALLVVSYGLLTVFPLFRPDCPYWTPLSGIFWRFLRAIDSWSHKLSYVPTPRATGDIVEHMVQQATKLSDHTEVRDIRALCWTVRSLEDDNALELFMDGISDAIWASGGRRHSNENLILGLLEDHEARVIPRTQQFLSDCRTELIPTSVATRRQIACLKAIWAIVVISGSSTRLSNSISSFDTSLLRPSSCMPLTNDHGASDYLPTVKALLLWNIFQNISDGALSLAATLRVDDIDISTAHALRLEMQNIAQKIRQLSAYVYTHKGKDLEALARVQFHASWAQDVLTILDEAEKSWNDIPYQIILLLLEESCGATAPYEFQSTCDIIITEGLVHLPKPSEALKESYETAFTKLVTANIGMLQHISSIHHIDIALGHLLSISYRESHNSRTFIQSVVLYLAHRNCTSALFCLLEAYGVNQLWPRIASQMNKFRAVDFVDDAMKAIWELSALAAEHSRGSRTYSARYQVDFEMWILGALDENATAYASATVLIKLNILSGLYRRHFEDPLVLDQLLRHPFISSMSILKEEKLGLFVSGNAIHEENRKVFLAACMEAHLIAVADFLMACSSPIVPYKAAETMTYITFPAFPNVEYSHRSPQLCLAKSVRSILRWTSDPALLQPLVAMLERNIHTGAVADALLEVDREDRH